MTGTSRITGLWASDPTHRHRLRYSDHRRWTEWVADDGPAERDLDGLRLLRRRRVLGVMGVVLLLGLGLAFVVGMALAQGPTTGGDGSMSAQDWSDVRAERVAIHREFDAWVLPASLQATGILERSGVDDPYAYEIRTYVPVGTASAEQAVADLQTALLARGWMYPYDETHPWSARKYGLDATMEISVEAGRIQVEIDG